MLINSTLYFAYIYYCDEVDYEIHTREINQLTVGAIKVPSPYGIAFTITKKVTGPSAVAIVYFHTSKF